MNKESQVGVGASGVDEYEGQSHSLGMKDVLRGCKRVDVIGIHGWFPGVFSIQISLKWLLKTSILLSGAMLRTVVGEVCFFFTLIISHSY